MKADKLIESARGAAAVEEGVLEKKARKLLLKDNLTLSDLADALNCSPKMARRTLEHLKAEGYNVQVQHGEASLSADIPSAPPLVVNSRDFFDGKWHKFGVLGDTHLGSKYARLDVLKSLYDIFEREGITTVLHTGNIVEGECRFNRHELVTRSGFEPQAEYLANEYPQRKGIETWFITGEDHEGWWIQREAINVGARMQETAEKGGRHDLKWIGHIERDIHFKAKKGSAWARVMHPGGGTAYAISYTTQKIVECVPLDTEILTRSGWKKHDEIEIGEEVLGYDITSGRCEWTELKAINRYNDAEVVSYENDQFRVRCTREHRWVMEWESRGGKNPASLVPTNYARRDRLMSTIDAAKDRSHIVQAAPAPDGEGIEFNEHLSILDRQFTVESVLRMTSLQRQAFIYGMMAGEGTLSGNGNTPVFSQRPGAVQDAFVLSCFLEGRATGIARITSKNIDGEEKVCCRTTILKKPTRMVTRSLREVGTAREAVWCPTTILGTWVMRQGSVVTITGNSFQGGEKPHMLFVGHYHKYEHGYPREVHTVQTGCVQDQSSFMRRLKIQAHLGGSIVRFHQAETGEINRFMVEWMPYYDHGFYSRNDKYRTW